MTINTSWYTMDNKAGVNLNTVVTSVDNTTAPNPDNPAPPALPGDRVQGNDGSEWLFVRASATVTAFNAVVINSNFRAQNMTSALVASNLYALGIAQFQPLNNVTAGNANGGVCNTDDYFWAMIKCAQNARINVTASVSVAAGAQLWISPTIPGFFTTSVSTGARMQGIVVPVSASGGGDITITEIGMWTYMLPQVLTSASA